MPIGLDQAGALDPGRVGAKASRLAAARRAGLNVLDGVVIETAHSRPFLSAAADVVRDKGPAAGRLAMMDIELAPELLDSVRDALDCERFVVRSSSPLEGGGEWSGAFASYVDVDPGSLETAVRGCWASMLGRDALERFERVGGDPAATGMAVLIQPFITPSPGGVAEADDGGVHITVADEGELAGLLQGWAGGSRAELPRAGAASGPAVDRHGAPLLEQVGDLARACRARIGDDHLEWAFSGGCCYLLQSRQTGTGPRAKRRRPASGLAGAGPASAWEALVLEAVLANGSRHSGEPAGPGLAAGRLLVLEFPRRLPGVRERWILHVTNPLPAFAPLLWGAAGLISATGNPSAHLFDVARTLGVPAVAGVDLTADGVAAHDGALVAVDGSTGDVAVL